jgi:predicted nucleotide-binding protein (sugar kinase/HSP70/actin superfamily)
MPEQKDLYMLKDHKKNRVLFTEDMKKDYTILAPMMLPIHFAFIGNIIRQYGYNLVILETTHRGIVDEGLKHVHNDTCYPALLVIGQLLDALKSGAYDPNKTALMITQTGGGCRASNYIHLLRKALLKADFPQVPVISMNLKKMEQHPGFKLSWGMIIKFSYAALYADMMMCLANQCRPYEVEAGATQKVIDELVAEISPYFMDKRFRQAEENYLKILAAFKKIQLNKTDKIKVGIVGEIYMKYAPLGNNNLEDYLLSEGAEPVLSGVLDFFLYSVNHSFVDVKLYKSGWVAPVKQWITRKLFGYLEHLQNKMIDIIKADAAFHAPAPFKRLQYLVKGFISQGVKMGEGWLLTAEMLELIDSGVNNIVCTQPFGCLPNHIVAKGMIRSIKNTYPNANIVAVDYDPGATKINQENRIKLMLANAVKLDKAEKEAAAKTNNNKK